MDWDELRKKNAAAELRKKYGIRDPDDKTVEEAKRDAHVRETVHEGSASQRKLSKGYDFIGSLGEKAFEVFIGPDSVEKSKKKNVNLIVNGKGINVLTARTPTWLLVEVGKIKADVFVLARFVEDVQAVEFLGWATREEVAAAPVSDYGGFGIMSHGVPKKNLHRMETLKAHLGLVLVQTDIFGRVL